MALMIMRAQGHIVTSLLYEDPTRILVPFQPFLSPLVQSRSFLPVYNIISQGNTNLYIYIKEVGERKIFRFVECGENFSQRSCLDICTPISIDNLRDRCVLFERSIERSIIGERESSLRARTVVKDRLLHPNPRHRQ